MACIYLVRFAWCLPYSSFDHRKQPDEESSRPHIYLCSSLLRIDRSKRRRRQDREEASGDSSDGAKHVAGSYKSDSKAQSFVEGSAGYAVFSNLGLKIQLAGSGNGKGLAVNNQSKQVTFMKMLELQAGLGIGVKKFRVVFVFDNPKTFNNFINTGWQFGGQSTAAAKTVNKGGAMAGAASISEGVWMYQLTDKGLALEITAKSTKYYKDADLN
jgi:lipid-binding SYLF domain-containing protein